VIITVCRVRTVGWWPWVFAALILAGCSSSQHHAVGGSAVTSESTTSTAATPTTGSPAEPVLGRKAPGTFAGIGEVEPTLIDTGGTADSTVSRVVWSSWGGNEAIGTGWWQPGGQQGGNVTVVAFNRGMCDGTLMYQSLEWYFTQSHVDPGYSHQFDPNNYLDICTQTAVGGQG
jgi:hypothetical protein